MTESQLKSKCKKWYQTEYKNNYILLPEQYIKTGDPDMVICHDGLFVAIEFKLEYNKPSKLQALKLKHIQESGGYAFVCYSFRQFKEIIKSIK